MVGSGSGFLKCRSPGSIFFKCRIPDKFFNLKIRIPDQFFLSVGFRINFSQGSESRIRFFSRVGSESGQSESATLPYCIFTIQRLATASDLFDACKMYIYNNKGVFRLYLEGGGTRGKREKSKKEKREIKWEKEWNISKCCIISIFEHLQ